MEKIKASDYIVEFLIKKGITDVFGYPGGMVTHLMESLDKYHSQIRTHLNYHEQACAMAACGWAEVKKKPGVAYATSGPGATNLLTGIACAYFDSIPTIFITGQVNTYEQKNYPGGRQKGFQETDIVSMAKPITKMAKMITQIEELPEALENAYRVAMEGRQGPVLLDIPMNLSREYLSKDLFWKTESKPNPISSTTNVKRIAKVILKALQKSKKPVILAGHGIDLSNTQQIFSHIVNILKIPVVSSMIAVDVLPSDSAFYYGMIGAYGVRWANAILNHSDCILTLGSRLDCRQTGVNTNLFAPHAELLRVDIDKGEFDHVIRPTEQQFCCDLRDLLPALEEAALPCTWDYSKWNTICHSVYEELKQIDSKEEGNQIVTKLSQLLPEDCIVSTDVGQNQVWVAQSFIVKKQQRILFCGGHGAMGYSLPSAIGAAIASGKKTIAFTGDGGLQMNLQELEFLVREQLPIKIVVLNNRALGMIHHFQEMYFQSNYVQTDDKKGYVVPSFVNIAKSFGMQSVLYQSPEQIRPYFEDNQPTLIEVMLPQVTHVFPKLGMNKPIDDQEPPLSNELSLRVADLFKKV